MGCHVRRTLTTRVATQKEALHLLATAYKHQRPISATVLGRVRQVVNRLSQARHRVLQQLTVARKQVCARACGCGASRTGPRPTTELTCSRVAHTCR